MDGCVTGWGSNGAGWYYSLSTPWKSTSENRHSDKKDKTEWLSLACSISCYNPNAAPLVWLTSGLCWPVDQWSVLTGGPVVCADRWSVLTGGLCWPVDSGLCWPVDQWSVLTGGPVVCADRWTSGLCWPVDQWSVLTGGPVVCADRWTSGLCWPVDQWSVLTGGPVVCADRWTSGLCWPVDQWSVLTSGPWWQLINIQWLLPDRGWSGRSVETAGLTECGGPGKARPVTVAQWRAPGLFGWVTCGRLSVELLGLNQGKCCLMLHNGS